MTIKELIERGEWEEFLLTPSGEELLKNTENTEKWLKNDKETAKWSAASKKKALKVSKNSSEPLKIGKLSEFCRVKYGNVWELFRKQV